MRRRLTAIVIALVLGVGLAVWLQAQGPSGGAQLARPEGAAEQKAPQRIVCMSPAAVEIAYGIGAGDRVVGISQFTVYPPEALEKPVCGGFIDPNYERLVALKPDLIVTQGAADDLRLFAADNGMQILSLDLTDLDSIAREMRRLGDRLGMRDGAERACAEMDSRLMSVGARAAGREPVPCLIALGWEDGSLGSISTLGPGTFLNDLVTLAGGRNIAADLPTGYGVLSKEALVERAPEVIVELHGEGGDRDERLRKVRAAWAGMSTLPAVQNGRIDVIEADYALIPGPRVVLIAERLAEILQGEGTP